MRSAGHATARINQRFQNSISLGGACRVHPVWPPDARRHHAHSLASLSNTAEWADRRDRCRKTPQLGAWCSWNCKVDRTAEHCGRKPCDNYSFHLSVKQSLSVHENGLAAERAGCIAIRCAFKRDSTTMMVL